MKGVGYRMKVNFDFASILKKVYSTSIILFRNYRCTNNRENLIKFPNNLTKTYSKQSGQSLAHREVVFD